MALEMASQKSNTVFLTEREAKRIREAAKDAIKKSSEVVGHAREKRDPIAAHQQATGAALMADMGVTQPKDQRDRLPALIVGQPYPPCTSMYYLRNPDPNRNYSKSR